MKTEHRKQARAKTQRRWSHDIGAGTFAKLLNHNDNKALSNAEALDLQLKAVTALENIKRGTDAKNAWRTLAEMVNILIAFQEATDVAIEPFDDVRAAESGLTRAQQRYAAKGVLALDGEAITALETCLEIHSAAQIRTHIDDHAEAWFCANDVCKVLGYSNPRQAVQKNCHEKGVSNRDTLTQGGKQELTFINEPNLYRLIIKSRKPEGWRAPDLSSFV